VWAGTTLKRYYNYLERKQSPLADWAFRLRHSGVLRGAKYCVRGSSHQIRIHRSAICKGVTFELTGRSHRIEIGRRCILRNVCVKVAGHAHRVTLNEDVRFIRSGEIHVEDEFCELVVGASTTFETVHLALTGHEKRILIGKDCMFAYDIDVRTGDSHAIVDSAGMKINPEEDVVIADHVWIASHCTILKGVVIGQDSIVGSRSTVTSAFGGNVLLGGSPARILKRGISWRRERFIV